MEAKVCKKKLSKKIEESIASTRLIDYFVVMGRGRIMNFPTDQDTDSPLREITFLPRIIQRYPLKDWRDSNLPFNLHMFAYSKDIRLITSSKADSLTADFEDKQLPKLCRWVFIKEDQKEQYCVALKFWEQLSSKEICKLWDDLKDIVQTKLDPAYASSMNDRVSIEKLKMQQQDALARGNYNEVISIRKKKARMQLAIAGKAGTRLGVNWGLGKQQEVVFAPRCICVVSSHPFWKPMEKFLKGLYTVSKSQNVYSIPIERLIANFSHEVPVPPTSGDVRVISQTDAYHIEITRASLNKMPLVDIDFSYLFRFIDHESIIFLLVIIMTEHRVLFSSSSAMVLSNCMEAIRALLFPMRWQGVYIPILPFGLVDFMFYPVPFLTGMVFSSFDEIQKFRRPDDVIVVNIDKNEIWHTPINLELPPDLHKHLASKLHKHANLYGKANGKTDLLTADHAFSSTSTDCTIRIAKIRKAFAVFWIKLLGGYQNFMIRPPGKKITQMFRLKDFLATKTPAAEKILSKFCDTQMWGRYVIDWHLANTTTQGTPLGRTSNNLAAPELGRNSSTDHSPLPDDLAYLYVFEKIILEREKKKKIKKNIPIGFL